MEDIRITELTPKQKEELEPFIKKWFAVGSSTEPMNFERAKHFISELYRSKNHAVPEFVSCSSPLEAETMIRKVSKQEGELAVFWGNQESYWIAFYLFCEKIIKEHNATNPPEKRVKEIPKEDLDALHLWADIALNCGWWYPFEKKCFICDRPEIVNWTNDEDISKKRIHSDLNPAVRYRDGFSVWALNGVRCSKEIVMAPADNFPSKLFLKEKNQEVRSQIIKKVGLINLFQHFEFSVLDHTVKSMDITKKSILTIGKTNNINHDEYILLNILISEPKADEKTIRPYLFMKDASSINKYYITGVRPETKTVEEALDRADPFSNGLPYKMPHVNT